LAETLNPENPDVSKLTTDQLKTVHPLFGPDVSQVFDYVHSIEQYDVIGGTARSKVVEQIEKMEAII
jgi:argininosuccinate lyase